MNILLTGGCGYIGSHVAVTLAGAGYKIIILDNFSNSNRKILEKLTDLIDDQIICHEGDVLNIQLLKSILLDYEVDAVIHLAGLKAVAESFSKPLNYYRNNVSGTLSLLEAMHEVGIKTLIFSSSATVYGKPDYLPLDEQHPACPISPYGRSKHYAEEIMADLVAADADWKINVLRYFNPAGAHSSGLIGEESTQVPNNLMPYILGVINKNYPYLNIFGGDYDTSDGTGERDYIHVMDLAEGHLAALNRLLLLGHSEYEVFNLGTGKSVSVLSMVRAYEAAISKKIPIKLSDRRAGDLPSCYANPEKANVMLGWFAKRNLEDICESGYLWQQKNSGHE